MQQRNGAKSNLKPDNVLPVDQCRLYKIGSHKKLLEVLGVNAFDLKFLLGSASGYRKFTITEAANPFTGKPRKKRAVQQPTGKLCQVHKRVLSLLRRVKYPDYVQGAVKHRSYQTNAAVHLGSRQTATFDIKDFYGSTKRHLVHAFFKDVMCCPTDIAGKLSKLLTCDDAVPTGSSLSPLLSFWVAKPMFDEIALIAESHGLKFTCYIDDLTFSGDNIPRQLKSKVAIACRRYGYELKHEKTRVFKFGEPAHITGVVKQGNTLFPPYARLRGVRKIREALSGNGESYGYSGAELMEKLIGSLVELASIDQQFKRQVTYIRRESVFKKKK